MEKLTKKIKWNLIAASLTIAFSIPWAPTIAAKGEVSSRALSAGIQIKIEDSDDIETYTVFERNGANWKPLKGYTNISAGCKPVETISLDYTHVHNHKVQYEDCSNGKEAWIANKLTSTTFIKGTPSTWQNKSSATGFTIEDINNDFVSDLVVTVENDVGITVGVLIGNGNGTFRKPSAEEGSIINIPAMVADDQTLQLYSPARLGKRDK